MALGDVYQTQMFSHAYQRQMINTFFWRETTESTDGNPALTLNRAMIDDIEPSFLDLISGQTVIGCFKTRKIIGADGPEQVTYRQGVNGTQTGQPMPGSSALRLNTAATVNGRPNRGSLIISGISEADITSGFFTADLTTVRLLAFVNALQGGLTARAGDTGEWEFGYMSRAGAAPSDPPVAWPGQFVVPTSYYSTGIPVAIRSRQGSHTQIPIA